MEKVKHFTDEQIATLALATVKRAKAQAKVEEWQEKREGSYTVATRLAAEYGDDFEPAMEHLFGQIRTNETKLARAFGAKSNDKGDGFKIPSSLSSAKSVLAGAMKLAVPLMDDEGEPRPFGQIRKDKKAAEVALALAERQDHEVARDTLADQLEAFAEALRAEDSDAALGEWCEGASEVIAEWTADVARLMGDEVTEGDDEATADEVADAAAAADVEAAAA